MTTKMVSKHFSRAELSCKHCGMYNASQTLIDGLEELRALGSEPIIVHDACRCEEHNRKVGGVRGSAHPKGEAADIEIQGLSMQQMYDRAVQVAVFRNGGIGVYDGRPFLHVDVRGERARWARVGGMYVAAEPLIKLSAFDRFA